MKKLFEGLGVALATPFDEDNKIDFKALEQIIVNQAQGGTDYLVALGTTAETPTLTANEKKDIVQVVRENAGELPVVAGMGGNDARGHVQALFSHCPGQSRPHYFVQCAVTYRCQFGGPDGNTSRRGV